MSKWHFNSQNNFKMPKCDFKTQNQPKKNLKSKRGIITTYILTWFYQSHTNNNLPIKQLRFSKERVTTNNNSLRSKEKQLTTTKHL